MNAFSKIFTPQLNRLLYTLLLIATPFLLLQNYLQSAIGSLSNLTWSIGETEIPVTVTVLLIFLIPVIILNFKKVNKTRILGWLIILLLFFIGQRSTDYYFNHQYYELQYNWHYFAYSIFAFINFRVIKKKGKTDSQIIINTFVMALAISTLDELLQMPLSNRIFDIGDISKDLWGTMIGLLFIYLILENGRIFKDNKFIEKKMISDIYQNPVSLLIALFIVSYIFMVVASLITETEYLFAAVLTTIVLSILIISISYYLRKKKTRPYAMTLVLIIIAGLIISFSINFNRDIVYGKNNLVIYKGIPVYFFDIMIYPDGSFRPVDKKTGFNQRDKNTIFSKCENILIIAEGTDGKGGKGFNEEALSQFFFDEQTMKNIQVIIQKNEDAILTFNRLKNEGKRPMLIYHND